MMIYHTRMDFKRFGGFEIAIQTLWTSVVGVEGRFGGVPRGFAIRSMGVGYGIRSMLREEPFLRWMFS